jgi:nucleotide-binding universal stress UspA family protein
VWRSIVVGTDGSQTAARAVAVAAGLAQESGARLHLVNGYRPPGPPDRALDHDDPTAAVWRQASEALLDEVLAEHVPGGLEVECHCVAGSPVEVLVGVARRVGADLIVVGNRGLQGPRRPGAPEPVPELVARAAPCHVLIAKTT